MNKNYLLQLFLFYIPAFIFSDEPIWSRASVCLNMIVRDEAHVMARVLTSVKPLIDYWVIVDTGSIDNTQEVILECLKDVPGELHARPWKNFGYNRTEALDLAKNKADYLLFIDADDWLDYDKSFQLPCLKKDEYRVFWTNQSNTFSYLKPLIVKSSLPWKWEGVMHEYLTCQKSTTIEELHEVRYVIGGNGARSKDPEKFIKVAKILEEALEHDPLNSRYMFYLAESYRDANIPEKALTFYEKRVKMQGWNEETYWSLLQIALIKAQLNSSTEELLYAYYKAHHASPHRAEPVYYLATLYNKGEQYTLAYECLKGWLSIPQPSKKDVLFHYKWIEDYGIKFQLSICAYYLGYYQESFDLHNDLLSLESLPSDIRERVEKNQRFPLEKLSNNSTSNN